MTDEERAALATFAREMSAAFGHLADALGDDRSLEAPYTPATVSMPWNERVLRQCLILREITDAGGSVEQGTWYAIASKYGYRGRGLAGFFRSNDHGLLSMDENGRVSITPRGRERLQRNRQRVDAALTSGSAGRPAS